MPSHTEYITDDDEFPIFSSLTIHGSVHVVFYIVTIRCVVVTEKTTRLRKRYLKHGVYVTKNLLLYEYRDLFIDMAVRDNRSELAIANRHQER